jgi:cellobiose-specific phosphotransferase system component IIB
MSVDVAVVLIRGLRTSVIATKMQKMAEMVMKRRVSISMTSVSDLRRGNWLVIS